MSAAVKTTPNWSCTSRWYQAAPAMRSSMAGSSARSRGTAVWMTRLRPAESSSRSSISITEPSSPPMPSMAVSWYNQV